MTDFKKVKLETVKFMRGKYKLDEVGNGKDQVKFKQGAKTIVTIDIREDKYTFLIIFGKAEREKFEAIKEEFSQYIKDHYDNTKTFHDGKWMFIDVSTLAVLEEIKKLVMIKKKPNRKPFPKENAVYSKCGMRCDLCVHYSNAGFDHEYRLKLTDCLDRVYGQGDWDDDGCPGCYGKTDIEGVLCEQVKCAKSKNLTACVDCSEYSCPKATVGYENLKAKSILADDVTMAILPFVPYQYGN
ncbi:MAG: DUF3788 family protein [Eubacteriales bacterium]|nr:DUF3788 family protein [Eubacteriales bacterium]